MKCEAGKPKSERSNGVEAQGRRKVPQATSSRRPRARPGLALLLGTALVLGQAAWGAGQAKFTEEFPVEKAELSSLGTNRFFNLVPGFQLVLEGKAGGKMTVLTITVLRETKVVDGVETRIVEERETVDGHLVEVSRNYFAISTRTSDVFYFGEDVDMYEGGKVTRHDGSWVSGVAGARFGLAMPGRPLVGARYYQELAPKVAMDRAEVVSVSLELNTPAGTLKSCLETEETSAIERGREKKVYAPGIGLALDGDLKLTRYGQVP